MITKRKVKDDIVIERSKDIAEYTDYVRSQVSYKDYVDTSKNSVSLGTSALGINKYQSIYPLKSVYDALEIKDDDSACKLEVVINGEVKVYPTDRKTIKMVKALAFRQVSYNVDYSKTLSYILGLLMKYIMQGSKGDIIWTQNPNFNDFQNTVFQVTTNYIDLELGGE